MDARSKAWACGLSRTGIVGSNPARDMDVCLLWVVCVCVCVCVVRWGLCVRLINRPEECYQVWCVWVWSWILDNEEALAHWGLLRHGKNCDIGYFYNKWNIHTSLSDIIKYLWRNFMKNHLLTSIFPIPNIKREEKSCSFHFLARIYI